MSDWKKFATTWTASTLVGFYSAEAQLFQNLPVPGAR